MKNQLRATSTIIAGTIGVGFLALPSALHKFGTFWGLAFMVLVTTLLMVINVAYSDIIVSDKGNKQIPGYARKYLGKFFGMFSTVVITLGNLGALLAFGIISGSALQVILEHIGISLSSTVLSLGFAVTGMLVMKYGVKLISKVTMYSIFLIFGAIILLLVLAIPNMDFSNVTPLNLGSMGFFFGTTLFAMFGTYTLPVIDEVIGYDRKKYRKAVFVSGVVVLVIYIVLALVISLALGGDVTGELVDSIGSISGVSALVLSLLMVLTTFTTFVLTSNTIHEILHYDYKVNKNIAFFLILITTLVLIAINKIDFEIIISVVGRISNVIQGVFIIAIWFVTQRKAASTLFKFAVGLCGVLLVLGMVI